MKKFIAASTIAAAATLVLVGGALAAAYTLFGGAELVTPGNASNTAASLVSDLSDTDTSNDYSGIDFEVPDGLTFAELETLSTDYNVTDDDCGGGSPRFTVGLDEDGNGSEDGYIAVYIGPSPNYTDCLPGWQSTGNLIGNNDAGRYDATFMPGGALGTYSDALTAYGDATVTSIALIVDSGWNDAATNGDDEQTVLIDNVAINDDVTTFETPSPESADDCKKGGWQELAREDGTTFKNQGDCIQYVNTGK
jgi:hypothetical protein